MTTRTILIAALALIAAACGGDAADETTTTAAETTTTTQATTTTRDETATTRAMLSPAEISFDAQETDGSTITVASVTLPAAGYVVVHADAGDGSPGPVIGHSELLPEGTSTDVVVELDEPLTETQTVFPMAHIDANGNGEYEFFPPDETIDVPAMTADGEVAVVGGEVTVTSGDAASDATVSTADTDLGEVLTGPDGLTLYLFQPDAQGESTCTGSCEANWPPVPGDVTAGEGVDASLLGTVERADGSVQATYDGWPLYTFVGDAGPGDVNGQGVSDVWFAVAPDGSPIDG